MTRKAGSIVIDRLRDRIRLGRYFGCWSPGDRLPSVREVAELENVDRKTAAAAYRRLEGEGLVQVEPRSGVYLAREASGGADPLQRLHLNWLERTLASAQELGLDAATANRMLQGVSVVERHRIPVVDVDVDHATLLAADLATRTGLECVATRPGDLPAEVGPLRDAPFVLATPRGREALQPLEHRLPIVTITLDACLLDEIRSAAGEARVVVRVGSGMFKRELEAALDAGLVENGDRVEVREQNGGRLPVPSTRVLDWPGSDDSPSGNGGAGRGFRLVAQSTIVEVRRQVARAALDHVNTSNASSTREQTAG